VGVFSEWFSEWGVLHVDLCRVDDDPCTSFTRGQLKIELGRQLLEDATIMSQTHVFTKPVAPGRGWYIHRDSTVPGDNSGRDANGRWMAEDDQPRCSLTTREVFGNTWGFFEGLVSPFSALKTSWDELIKWRDNISASLRETVEVNDSTHDGPELQYFALHLDAYQDLAPLPDLSKYHWWREASRQSQFADWVLKEIGDCLEVLLLGSRETHAHIGHHSNRRAFGLLLLPQSSNGLQCYRRIGFCWWEHDLSVYQESFMSGHSFLHGDSGWESQTGIFG
jgi:hypothetical protein